MSGLTITRSGRRWLSHPRWRGPRGARTAALCLTLAVGAASMLAAVPAQAADGYATGSQSGAQTQRSLAPGASQRHRAPVEKRERSIANDVSTLGGVLEDSLGNAVSGATISVYPLGDGCGEDVTASTTTGSGGSFSVSVSPGSYDVGVSYGGGSADPDLSVCTDNVDLSTSVNDTLTLPVTQLPTMPTQRTLDIRDAIEKVACPDCKAPRGTPCRRLDGGEHNRRKNNNAHKARIAAAKMN